MRLSPAAELALRGMLVLANHHGQAPIPLAAICKQRKLPREYLTKIFALLAKADLVTPVRGKRGGYRLARPPGKITLLEVIEAIEGPLALNYCQHQPSKCDQTLCAIQPVWAELQQIIRKKLSSVTLADCAVVKELKAAVAISTAPAVLS